MTTGPEVPGLVGWVWRMLALTTVAAVMAGCTSGGGGDEQAAASSEYRSVANLCEVVQTAVGGAWAVRGLGAMDITEVRDGGCLVEECCVAPGEVRPSRGGLTVTAIAADDPEAAQRIFDQDRGARDLPGAEAGGWDASSLSTTRAGGTTVRLRLLDSNLVLDLMFVITGAADDEDAQQAVLVDLADQIREAARS